MSDTTYLSVAPRRFGRPDGAPGLIVREVRVGSLATLMARRGQGPALAAAVRRELGVELPQRPRVAHAASLSFIWSGPGHWLVQSGLDPDALAQRLDAVCADLASAFDQSDSRVLVDLDGPRVREVLAKGFAVDLDAAAFEEGAVALGLMSHVGVQLWQMGTAPAYRIAIARGYFGSWMRWLEASAAEYGGLQLPMSG